MFTNDGELAEKLTHPSYDKKKIYQVVLDHELTEEDHDKIIKGIEKRKREVNLPLKLVLGVKLSQLFPRLSDKILLGMFK